MPFFAAFLPQCRPTISLSFCRRGSFGNSSGAALLGRRTAVDLGDHLDHGGELVRLQARAPHQAAVAEWELDVGADVVGADAAPIEDSDAGRGLLSERVVEDLPNRPHGPVGVLRVRA